MKSSASSGRSRRLRRVFLRRDYLKVVILALTLSVCTRTFLFQPFTIPSGSMIPTLQVGDYLFVSKYSYGYSRYSLPFDLPIIKGRLFSKMPRRGDVVVFRSTNEPSVDYVKRVVGLPGDLVQMKGGILHINEQPVLQVRSGMVDYLTSDGLLQKVVQYREILPGSAGRSASFLTVKLLSDGPLDNTPPVRVPEGHFFAMGDNRDNSSDSRVFGPVPLRNLVGRALFVLFSQQNSRKISWWGIGLWTTAFRWDRFFHTVV